MILTDGESRLEIEVLEIEQYPAAVGDKRCHIHVTAGNFSGFDKNVWFRAAACQQFVQELKQLEKSRKGTATLQAMSDELCLKLEVYHPLGGVAVMGYLKSSWLGLRSRLTSQLNFEFGLDPQYLLQTVAQFEQILGQ
jgi:hypothetical protein